jgi:protein ImuB
LASITGERRRLSDVLEEKLKRLELPAPVRAMELSSGSLLPLPADSLDAFAGLRGAGGRTCDTAPQLVERLRARLGEQAVYGVRPVAEHRPEAAWQRVQELWAGAGPGQGLRVLGMPRPVWLLETPVPLSAALRLDEGPERIESGWWDGKGVTRDYYVAHPPQGGRWWVFQERQTKLWYLHGVFA